MEIRVNPYSPSCLSRCRMSPDILKETQFLLYSALLGITITFAYDWFRIFRRILPHNNFFVSFEDLIYWVMCSVAAFAVLYKVNNGTLRWFAVIGATLGMFVYKLLISRYFVKAAVFILQKVLGIIGKAAGLLFRPLLWGGSRIAAANRKGYRFTRKLCRFLKNKLTQGLKMVKIMLCKH